MNLAKKWHLSGFAAQGPAVPLATMGLALSSLYLGGCGLLGLDGSADEIEPVASSTPSSDAEDEQAGIPWGDDGEVLLTVGDHDGQFHTEFVDMDFQSDGKVVVLFEYRDFLDPGMELVDRFGLVRYGPDGEVDSEFGADGMVRLHQFGFEFFVTALEVDGEDRIVLAGKGSAPVTHDPTLFVARLLADGTVDAAFGPPDGLVDGQVEFEGDFAAVFYSLPLSLLVQSDDKIIVGGSRYEVDDSCPDEYASCDLFFIRYDENGALDPSFGNGGIGALSLASSGVDGIEAYDMDLDAQGRIVVAGQEVIFEEVGEYISYLQGDSMIAIRITAEGALDNSFDSDGISVAVFDTLSAAVVSVSSVALQEDGKIWVGGESYYEAMALSFFAMVRFNEDGSVDTTVGDDNGLVESLVINGLYGTWITDLQVLGNRIYALGWSVTTDESYPHNEGNRYGQVLAAYSTLTGVLDQEFATSGVYTREHSYDYFQSLLPLKLGLQSDGKLLAGFTSYDFEDPEVDESGRNRTLNLLRFLDEGVLDSVSED